MMGKREVETIETITAHNYPEEFSAIYETDGVWNLIENRFFEISEHQTKWIVDSECRPSGIVMKIMAVIMPGLFKKQTLTFMQQFKEFAESA